MLWCRKFLYFDFLFNFIKYILQDVSKEICRRLVSLFEPDPSSGKRPCHGDSEMYANDEFWKDLILFHEYFQAETGRGCGARFVLIRTKFSD